MGSNFPRLRGGVPDSLNSREAAAEPFLVLARGMQVRTAPWIYSPHRRGGSGNAALRLFVYRVQGYVFVWLLRHRRNQGGYSPFWRLPVRYIQSGYLFFFIFF